MPHRYRVKTAWISYLGIQVFWVLCVFIVPLGVAYQPSRLWAAPFCLVTIAGGLHMAYFWHEYNALMRKTIRLLPFERHVLRHLSPAQRDPKHFVLFGTAYTLVGLVSLALVVWAHLPL